MGPIDIKNQESESVNTLGTDAGVVPLKIEPGTESQSMEGSRRIKQSVKINGYGE
jgi:hypothetical protein